ncbi:MAG: aminoglycoside phosphotransferase family protein [Lentisphaeria bacterium]
MKHAEITRATVRDLLSGWNIVLKTVRRDIPLAGSPQRSLQRLAVEDSKGELYVLEEISVEQAEKRRMQAEILNSLAQLGLSPLHPWLPDRQRQLLHQDEPWFWQLRKYVMGNDLLRETYGNDAWRGREMGQFLVRFRSHVNGLQGLPASPFSLVHYVDKLMPVIQAENPSLFSDLQPIWQELAVFRKEYPNLPLGFCHGDYHPLNVIWGETGLNSVIDWEFLGYKAEGYDAANLLGCLGMDDPRFLTAEMALALLTALRQAELFQPATWYWLPEFVAALRFAWMREWFRRKERKMQIQELDFLWLLLDNRECLRKKWSCSQA